MKEELQSELRMSAKIFQPNSLECKNHENTVRPPKENSPHRPWGASGTGSNPLLLWGCVLVVNLDLRKSFSLRNTHAIVQGQTKVNCRPKLRTPRVNP